VKDRPKAKYVVVSAITPIHSVRARPRPRWGSADALRQDRHKRHVAIRQPSMGRRSGIKGGAAGGGYSQVVPMERLELHSTGDFHAVTAAHNRWPR